MKPEVASAMEILRRAGFSILSPVAVRWLTLGEVATHLSVSKRTVSRLIDAGEIAPVLRWGSEVRVSERALQAWVEQHQTPRAGAKVQEDGR